MIGRAPSNKPLCRQVDDEHPGGRCPKGTPENQRELSAGNEAALRFHRLCKATGNWPEDEQVERNATIIEHVLAEWEAQDRWQRAQNLEAMLLSIGRLIAGQTPRLP